MTKLHRYDMREDIFYSYACCSVKIFRKCKIKKVRCSIEQTVDQQKFDVKYTKMNDDPVIGAVRNSSGWFSNHADTKLGIGARALLAQIPILGPSAVVVIEAQLAAQRECRIADLLSRVERLEADPRRTSTPLSDRIVEKAVNAAADDADGFRIPMYAMLMYPTSIEDDPQEVIRTFLIDVCSKLTRYEFAVLIEIAGITRENASSNAEMLLRLRSDRNYDEVHQYTLENLKMYRLIDTTDGEPQLTSMGNRLVSVV